MSKAPSQKISEFLESTLDAGLALVALAIDAVFWFGWAYMTELLNDYIGALKISGFEVWPYKIAQWSGCGVLAVFVVFRSIKDLVSLWDSFIDFWKSRK